MVNFRFRCHQLSVTNTTVAFSIHDTFNRLKRQKFQYRDSNWCFSIGFWLTKSVSQSVLTIYMKTSRVNGNPSKNPDIKSPLVVSFSLGVAIHFLPLAALWRQDSSWDSYYFLFLTVKSVGPDTNEQHSSFRASAEHISHSRSDLSKIYDEKKFQRITKNSEYLWKHLF